MNKNIFFIVLVVLLIGAGIYMSNSNSDLVDNDQEDKVSRVRPLDEKREVGDIVAEVSHDGDGAIVEEEDGFGSDLMEDKDDAAMAKVAGEYVDYDPQLLDRAGDGDVVLFFHAGWCPSCKILDKGLKSDLSDFPEDLTILKVDYDNSKDLKKKYAVTYQHTLVQVDAQGNMLNKWNGGNNLSDVLNKLK